MRFSDTFLEEIRQHLSISQVVGEYVTWDKRKSQPGRGDYWACCPFHGEKTPSFHADDRRGHYHCFGCGVSGDHFRFLTEHGGLRFPEAVEKLAGIAGIPLPARDKQEEKRDAQRASLYDVMELATQYFEAALAHNIGARARGYLNERRVSASMQSRFRVGFAPDSRNGLKEHLAANGIPADQQNGAGLVVTGDDIAVPYDRFRNRLMFPIADFSGRIVAFGGRALSEKARAKYLNSPEGELFHKRKTLYNGQTARKAARAGKPVIVVEGYLDVIASVMAGFEGAVAPLGTALSEEHVAALWRMNDMPVLCFDGDEAGQRAMARLTEIIMPMLEPGKSVRFATLPPGLDPDDVIHSEGQAAFESIISEARPLSETVWNLETAGGAPATPEARAALEQRLRDRANQIRNASVKHHYLEAFKEKLNVFFAPVRRADDNNWRGERAGNWRRGRQEAGRRNFDRGRGKQSPAVSETLRNSRLLKKSPGNALTPREAVIVLSLVHHPRLAENMLEQIAALEFRSASAKKLLSALIDAVTVSAENGSEDLGAVLGGSGFGADLDQLRDRLALLGVWQVGPDANELDVETGLIHALALHNKSVELNRELRAVEMALGQDPSEESFERLRDIQNQITSVDGTEALIEGFGSLSGRASPSF